MPFNDQKSQFTPIICFFLLITLILQNLIALSLAKEEVNGNGKEFLPKVEWECSESAISISVHTRRPFSGLINAKGFQQGPCALLGEGRLSTRLHIALNGSAADWRQCGLRMEPESSTLWTLLEVHEHPLLILENDRLVNVTCAGWPRHGEDPADGRQYRLVFRPADPDQMPSAKEGLLLGQPYDLSLLANRIPSPADDNPQPSVLLHSCILSTLDQSDSILLLDSDGCTLDSRLMGDFRPVPGGLSPAPANSSSSSLLGSVRVPHMFRFAGGSPNSPADRLVRVQCAVEPCGRRASKAACEPPDCEVKRMIMWQQAEEGKGTGGERTTMAPTEGGQFQLVTQLMGASGEGAEGQMATATQTGTEAENGGRTTNRTLGSAGNQSSEMVANSANSSRQTTTTKLPPHQQTTAVRSTTGAETIARTWTSAKVATVVRVLDKPGTTPAGTGGGGMVNSEGTTGTEKEGHQERRGEGTMGRAEGGGEQDGNGPKASAGEGTVSPSSASAPYASPPSGNLSRDARVQVLRRHHPASSPSPAATLGQPISSPPSSPSALLLFPPPPGSNPPNGQQQQCISADQLLLLYRLAVGLCALFLLGCCSNLFICCLSGRRAKKSHSPLRTKRGRRQQVVVVGPCSQSTLSSSIGTLKMDIDGGSPPAVHYQQHKQSAKECQRQQQQDYWIKEGAPACRNGSLLNIESALSPMVSSVYGCLPVPGPPSCTATGIGPGLNNRRSSVHSYASVKASNAVHRSAAQLLSAGRIIQPNQQQQQTHPTELALLTTAQSGQQRQSNSPPPANSPSTMTSSSGGKSGYNFFTAASFMEQQPKNGNGRQQQQLSSTFVPIQGERHVNFDSSIASSVRSSTLETPSPSDSDPNSSSCGEGNSTPRPSSDPIQQPLTAADDSQNQLRQQQQQQFLTAQNQQSWHQNSSHNNINNSHYQQQIGGNGNTKQQHNNESFSIL